MMQRLIAGGASRGASLRKQLHMQFHMRSSRAAPLSPTRLARRAMAASSSSDAYCFDNRGRAQTLVEGDAEPTVVEVLSSETYEAWLAGQSSAARAWMASLQFKGKDGEVCLLPGAQGGVDKVVVSIENTQDIWAYAALPAKLPGGTYRLKDLGADAADAAALGWLLGSYKYERYKSKVDDSHGQQLLQWPPGCDRETVLATGEAIFIARDIVTTPAEDMTPQAIVREALAIAAAHGATAAVTSGDDLLAANYPAIHTVGRASANPPALVDLRWAPAGADAAALPRVTLVGKGVSFDTGGLDLKPAAAMKLMKKDCGGSATILGLAHLVMASGLPVRLRVLVPAVENSVSGNAFRPLDVLQTRAGITVENGNTDAEGRLILCDALAEGAAEAPELLIDAATLTGAARVALGTELPALFCNDDAVAEGLLAAGVAAGDPLWRLPLHEPYRKMLDSRVADIGSCSEGGYAGAITAALFLREFVKGAGAWVHVDTMAYNLSSKPGRPEGGEAFGLRALFAYLKQRYGGSS